MQSLQLRYNSDSLPVEVEVFPREDSILLTDTGDGEMVALTYENLKELYEYVTATTATSAGTQSEAIGATEQPPLFEHCGVCGDYHYAL